MEPEHYLIEWARAKRVIYRRGMTTDQFRQAHGVLNDQLEGAPLETQPA